MIVGKLQTIVLMSRLFLVALAAISISAARLAAADVGTRVGGDSKAVTLTGTDLDAVRRTACSPYGVGAESVGPALRWTYGGRYTPVIEVNVKCAPHTVVNDRPSHYNVSCKRDDDRHNRPWQCLGGEEITVPTSIGDIAVEPGPYSHERATQTVQAALASSLFRDAVRTALPTGCRLASNWSGQQEEVAELSCASGHHFLFSFWCPTQMCPRLMTATEPGE